ncbi:molybdate-anion transporter-like [Hydractinia symbiolongicarpus]|uniref:molybdate-anion transporter-like n=1 Tax=Hydractinia symbiolongicarpus TaxID=13093 RepID=UPI00254B551C|nr:molybdate-anion transporter-like [Hydractinia symbiolongicarpus]
MLIIAYFVFVVLFILGFGLGFKSWKGKKEEIVVNNPAFIEFQSKYFRVYFLALLAEWLQGPYLFKLYSDYSFVDPYIGIIYVCGFVSSILFGTYTGVIADKWGRKKICVLFTILYSICCLTKISSNFTILCVGRILGGVSTSLLFSAFDAWYMYEHTQTYQFPSEWLDVTFSKATFYNSVIAISAGLIANMLSEWMGFGAVAPFLLAIPFLVIAGILIQVTWTENHGKSGHACRGCFESLRSIVLNKSIFLIGAVQAMFESVMYIFVFLWTPVLLPANPPLGIVFSSFMCAIWIGGSIFEYLLKRNIKSTTIISGVVYGVMFANFLASLASANHPRTSFFLFLITELLCGIYFPAMGRLRSKILPAAQHSAIMNWFRVPLNTIASVVLLVLHDSHSNVGISHMFTLCACLLLCGGVCSILLHQSMNSEDVLQKENSPEV